MFRIAARQISVKNVVGMKMIPKQVQPRIFFSTNLKETFELAVKSIQKGPNSPTPKKEVDNMMKLQLYAYFKQATEGSCKGDRPGMFDMINRAKYDAWKALGNLSQEEAQQKYIDVVKDVFGGVIPLQSSSGQTTASSSPAPAQAAPSQTAESPNYSGPVYKSFKDVVFQRKANPVAPNFQTVLTSVKDNGVGYITLNRPNRGNAFNFQQWEEFRQTFNYFNSNSKARVIVLGGSGASFSTGMDLSVFMEMQSMLADVTCEARKRESGMYNIIQYLQDIISAPEVCPVPVISAVHGNCIGGAVDLICATDLRYCTKDTIFCIKETDLAMVADIGTLQRLPKLIGPQRAYELTYTARNFTGAEAEAMGLVVKAFDTKEEMMKHVNETAELIAKKSPLTIRGVKKTILYTRDHTVQDSLHQIKLWNSAFFFSTDLAEAAVSIMTKQPAEFKEE